MNSPTVATTAENGLIPKGVAARMAQDAVLDPPAIRTNVSTVNANLVVSDTGPSAEMVKMSSVLGTAGLTNFNRITCCLMVTVNISDSRFLEGQAKHLGKVKDVDGTVHNLYSPFRKGKDAKGIVAGVFRPLLNRTMKILGTINDSNLVIAGKQGEVATTLKNAVGAARAEIEGLFPKFEVAEADEESDGGEAKALTPADVFRTTSWVNMSHPSAESSEGVAIAEHSGIVNFIVNSGVIYDDADRIKMIRQLEATLQLIGSKNPSVPILLGVTFASEDIEYGEIRELHTMLLDEDMYDVFSRTKLARAVTNPEEAQDWIPQSKAGIERDLLPANADLIFLKVIGADEEDEEGDEAAE